MGSRLDGGVRTKKTELISGVLSSRSVEPNSFESVREVVRSLSADEALSLLSNLQLFWEESSRIKEHQGAASLIATDLRDVIFSNNGKASTSVVEQCVDSILSRINGENEISTQDFNSCIYRVGPIISRLSGEPTRKIKTDILKLIRKTPKDTFYFRQAFWLSTFVSAMAFVYLLQKYCIFRRDSRISEQYYTEVSQLPILDAREKLALPAEAFDPKNFQLSKSLWSTACEAINEIWLDASKYKADRVFTTDDVQVLRGAILCLVDENSPEFTNTLAEYWRKLAVAPNPKAKTMASQSIAAAIANAVADRPSIETIVAMREVKPEIRHAGMKKKFDRQLRKAERNLSSQPDFILRLLPDYPISKKMRTTIKLSMETVFLREDFSSLETWERHFRSIPEIWALAKGLIWLVQFPDGARSSVILREVDGELEWSDAHQKPVQMTEGVKIRLWHPVIANDADREDWRNAIVESGLKQPFAQAYREFYQLSEEELSSGKCALFSETRVGVRHVLGVSNAVGWTLMDGNLEKVVAPWKFTIDAGGIYPSADGETILGDLHVAISHGDAGWVTTSFNNIPKIVVSEILRNVDLISAIGERGHAKLIEDIEAEASRSRARREHWMRKRLAEDPVTVRSHLLERLFAKQIESGALSIADGKVLVSGYEIRIGDGAVYLGVDEIEIERLKSVLMLPHDDKIAETIVVAVTSILAK